MVKSHRDFFLVLPTFLNETHSVFKNMLALYRWNFAGRFASRGMECTDVLVYRRTFVAAFVHRAAGEASKVSILCAV